MADGMSPDDELTRDDVAELVHVQPNTWSAYVARGQAPPPHRHIGRTPVWRRQDITTWTAARPGQGRRSRRVEPGV